MTQSPLQSSIILSDQENKWEQKIISKDDFNIMIEQYIESLDKNFREKAFIDENTYNDIINILAKNENLRTSSWRSWARSNFALELIGPNYIVCKIPSNRTKEAMEKRQNEVCNAHAQLAHAGISNTYAKLNNKWGNVKQVLVAKFISKCITCALRKSSMTKEIEGKPIIARGFLSRVQVIIIIFCYLFINLYYILIQFIPL
jgi:hypothetical protein